MPVITIPCPDSVLISLKETPEHFAAEAMKLLAIKLYEMGKQIRRTTFPLCQ